MNLYTILQFHPGTEREERSALRSSPPPLGADFSRGMRHGSAILWIILSLAALAAVGAIAVSNQSFYQEFLRASAPTPIPKRPQEAWIEIDFGNGKKRVFLGRVGNERYALSSALEAASREGGFTFRVREDVVDTIGGVRGKWEVSRNGTPVEELLSELTIRGGERYTFRFAP